MPNVWPPSGYPYEDLDDAVDPATLSEEELNKVQINADIINDIVYRVENRRGLQGIPGAPGDDGAPGAAGPSAYDVALAANPAIGDETAWLASLTGPAGTPGGPPGASAYEIAYDLDETIGTPEEWLASLNGTNGLDGESAYEIAFGLDPTIGTPEEWIASLNGTNGTDGDQGPQGLTGTGIIVLAVGADVPAETPLGTIILRVS